MHAHSAEGGHPQRPLGGVQNKLPRPHVRVKRREQHRIHARREWRARQARAPRWVGVQPPLGHGARAGEAAARGLCPLLAAVKESDAQGGRRRRAALSRAGRAQAQQQLGGAREDELQLRVLPKGAVVRRAGGALPVPRPLDRLPLQPVRLVGQRRQPARRGAQLEAALGARREGGRHDEPAARREGGRRQPAAARSVVARAERPLARVAGRLLRRRLGAESEPELHVLRLRASAARHQAHRGIGRAGRAGRSRLGLGRFRGHRAPPARRGRLFRLARLA
mmetsp:Transcript_37678/g.121493  ORF Transcript_37678/g.121493 Transcript_37678/m.121493 type:complete len:280 (-) Transcript_37678:631-1470(-)